MTSHVVVDGSNLATEGRKTPSLAQLTEAVEHFVLDRPHDLVTVICDASFPNRIEESERRRYEELVDEGWLITPPAGAIGRGDAFILQVAAKANAGVLSNDSFQEFHGQHRWLFDDGRLVGGKPVAGVGWVFVDRLPVRGPTSRKAVRDADRTDEVGDAPAEAKPPKKRPKKAAPARKRASKAEKKPEPVAADKSTETVTAPTAKRRARKLSSKPAESGSSGAGDATVEVSSDGPVPNEAKGFSEFVAAHPVDSQVLAKVESFASHGAYALVGELRCFVPIKGLGDPAPRRAKDVLALGDEVMFTVSAIHGDVHGIDLALRPKKPPRRRTKKLVAATKSDSDAVASEPKAKKSVTRKRVLKASQTKAPATRKRTRKKAVANKTVAKKTQKPEGGVEG